MSEWDGLLVGPDRIIRHENGDTFPTWDTELGRVTVEWVPGCEISMFDGDYLLGIDDARRLARILLSAAAETERGKA